MFREALILFSIIVITLGLILVLPIYLIKAFEMTNKDDVCNITADSLEYHRVSANNISIRKNIIKFNLHNGVSVISSDFTMECHKETE